MLETEIINRLGLSRTSLTQPEITGWGVIPSDETSSQWDADLGDAGP